MDLRQEDVATRIGVSLNPVQTIERGSSKRVTTTIRAYASLVRWAPGSVEAVLDGGEPTVEEPAAPDSASLPSDLPLRIVQELREGPLLEATVIDLGEPGSSGRAIVIVRGQPDATQEQVVADLKAWARKDLKLRNIRPPEDNGDGAAAEA